MSDDIIALARRHKHVAPTHYEGCEADHIGCLVNKLADEVEGLRAQLEDRYIAMRVRQLEEALDAERQTVRRLRATNKQLVTGIDNISRRNREEIERMRAALEGKP